MGDSDELAKLGDLHSRGILSADEFARAKARVLMGPAPANGQPPIVRAINGLRRSRSDRWLGGRLRRNRPHHGYCGLAVAHGFLRPDVVRGNWGSACTC